jgi:hypothetical protein
MCVCVHAGVPLTRVAGWLQAGSVRSCCIHCTAATGGVRPYMRRAGSVEWAVALRLKMPTAWMMPTLARWRVGGGCKAP